MARAAGRPVFHHHRRSLQPLGRCGDICSPEGFLSLAGPISHSHAHDRGFPASGATSHWETAACPRLAFRGSAVIAAVGRKYLPPLAPPTRRVLLPALLMLAPWPVLRPEERLKLPGRSTRRPCQSGDPKNGRTACLSPRVRHNPLSSDHFQISFSNYGLVS